MQSVMIHEQYLEERRRLGHDRFDEVWAGVLHMVPPPSLYHQRLEGRLQRVLEAVAAKRDCIVVHEAGLFNPAEPDDKDYRQPDVMMARREVCSRRGIEGAAELVIEIRSPRDESYEKLPFYASMGVREVWIIEASKTSIEVYNGSERVKAVGGVLASALGLELRVEGHFLKIKDGADMYDVDISDSL